MAATTTKISTVKYYNDFPVESRGGKGAKKKFGFYRLVFPLPPHTSVLLSIGFREMARRNVALNRRGHVKGGGGPAAAHFPPPLLAMFAARPPPPATAQAGRELEAHSPSSLLSAREHQASRLVRNLCRVRCAAEQESGGARLRTQRRAGKSRWSRRASGAFGAALTHSKSLRRNLPSPQPDGQADEENVAADRRELKKRDKDQKEESCFSHGWKAVAEESTSGGEGEDEEEDAGQAEEQAAIKTDEKSKDKDEDVVMSTEAIQAPAADGDKNSEAASAGPSSSSTSAASEGSDSSKNSVASSSASNSIHAPLFERSHHVVEVGHTWQGAGASRQKVDAFRESQKKDVETWKLDKDSNPHATDNAMATIFVGRLSYDADRRDLLDVFEQFGPVRRIVIVKDPKSGRPAGYAFVEFDHQDAVKVAYKRAHRTRIRGRPILVDVERGRTVPGWLPRRFGGGKGRGRRKAVRQEGVRAAARKRRKLRKKILKRQKEQEKMDRRKKNKRKSRSGGASTGIGETGSGTSSSATTGATEEPPSKRSKTSLSESASSRRERSRSRDRDRDRDRGSRRDRDRDRHCDRDGYCQHDQGSSRDRHHRDRDPDRDRDRDETGTETGTG